MDDKINESPVARGVVNNLGARGEALVNSGGALREKYEREGVGGVLSAMAEGVVNTAKDTAEAAIDVGYYGAKAVAEGDSAALEKAASRGVDVVLGTADTVAAVGGAGGAAATGGRLGTALVEGAASTMPKLAPAAGALSSGGGGALVATGSVASDVISAGGATIVAMKNQSDGKGGGGTKTSPTSPEAGSGPARTGATSEPKGSTPKGTSAGGEVSTTPKVHAGAQGKHIPGHSNYEPGRSILAADAEQLAARAGTGEQVGKIKVGQPGSRERVDFGETIGQFIEMGATEGVDTTVGIIHYSKRGIHIVPARPK